MKAEMRNYLTGKFQEAKILMIA